MSRIDTEFRTKFDMQNDIGEQFDMLERKAQDAFISIFASDTDPFEHENRLNNVRWRKQYE